MTPADTFRAAWTTARAAGYHPCTRSAFADLVLCAPALFTARLYRGAVAWAREHPEPERTSQRRLAAEHTRWAGWLAAQDEPYLRVVEEQP